MRGGPGDPQPRAVRTGETLEERIEVEELLA
jgi:hypothetical protein